VKNVSEGSRAASSCFEGVAPPYRSDVRTSSASGCAAATRASASAFARPYAVIGESESSSTYGAPLRPSKTTSVDMWTSRTPTAAAARATFSEPIVLTSSSSCRYAVWITTSGRTRANSSRTASASRTSTRSVDASERRCTSSEPR
jgi:hypothetical protein